MKMFSSSIKLDEISFAKTDRYITDNIPNLADGTVTIKFVLARHRYPWVSYHLVFLFLSYNTKWKRPGLYGFISFYFMYLGGPAVKKLCGRSYA